MRYSLHPARVTASIASCLLVLSGAASVAAAPPVDAVSADNSGSAVATAEDRAASAIARSLSSPAWRTRVRKAVLTSDEVSITSLATEAGSAARPTLLDAERQIATAKGLGFTVGPLLHMRLGADSMRAALAAGDTPWVAAAVNDDDTKVISAYDTNGQIHALDVRSVPTRPVYVVDIDGSKALAAGLDIVREVLHGRGLSSPAPTGPNSVRKLLRHQGLPSPAGAASSGYWTTRVTSVRVSDDEEPWIKGKAEIYTLVTGFGYNGKARVDAVNMPYLDKGKTTYHPNQILINWSYYKYNQADVVMMEDDGNTNYRDLAKAISAGLLGITDLGAYTSLTDAVLNAIPDNWWTDDDDFVESWYSLYKNANGSFHGARGNGWMNLQPYFVEQF
ncbi:DUF3103 family protein [Streptomyces sp. NPDC056069]|uniref:DUF3103 family protein n=1 Tax=Streptomyces sp. NPDC056069 TaxID=3345702 RepID=UPI0035E1A04D